MPNRLAWLLLPLLTGCFSDDDNSSEPVPELSIETSLPVLGENCDFGGVRVESGPDTNRDGQLQSSEINSARVDCANSDAPAVNTALRSLVLEQGITGNPAGEREFPHVDEPLPQLGMLLFFSQGLSGDMDTACGSCHHPAFGGSDGKTLPVGVAAEVPDMLGPGRRHRPGATGFDGGPTMPRNSPTIFNISLWQQRLFHDGRLETVAEGSPDIRTPDVPLGTADLNAGPSLTAALVRFPVTPEVEMRGFEFEQGQPNDSVRSHLEARFQGAVNELPANDWLTQFRIGFDQPDATAEELITYDNIAIAIAAYMESQTFTDTPFRRYIEGNDDAMSGDAKLGALIFYGEAGCDGCHSGDFMTDESFHVLAMPQIGRGKDDDNGSTTNDDFGRFRETGLSEDRYAFRTPTLLNVAVTSPFGHAGAYASLEDVIRHHLDPWTSVENFDLNQLEPGVQTDQLETNTSLALDQLQLLRDAGASALPVNEMQDERIGYLVAFLEHLTDSCVADPDCVRPWVPDETDPDPDLLQLRPVDEHGNPL